MVTGDLAMLAIRTNFLDEACFKLRRGHLSFVRHREGSKSSLVEGLCMLEEDLFVLDFSLR